MNQTMLENQRSLRCKTPIVLLSIIALIFAGLSHITTPFMYNQSFTVLNLIFLLLDVAPLVLFLLYILKFHKEFKATILVPITFGLIAFNPLFYYIWNVIASAKFGYYISSSYLIFDAVPFVTFGLATFSALKGFNKKIFLLIAIIVGLLEETLSILSAFVYVDKFSWSLGAIAFYIALLLFATKNRIPTIISVSSKKKSFESMNPEQALKELKEKLDFGLITEEEYQAQRTELISKL